MSVSLYRKYRPDSFSAVKDQDHIVHVLQGAINKNELPHALLFSGGRGTGKTTLARIVAKEIGTSHVDVYEIDAASNRGIDDIRELREAVQTVPYESKYKVYIIDEVHMLTKEAFNALLKTLEEPPAHVLFILATTEEDKLLDTILSRCQVFRFRSPSRAVLVDLVIDVASKEGYSLQKSSADMIAIAADGSFRDALGITQKVLLASDNNVGDADEVANIIGAPRHATLQKLISAMSDKDINSALEAVDTAIVNHVDMKLLMRLILEELRLVILIRYNVDKVKVYLENNDEERIQWLKELASKHAKTINSHTIGRLLQSAEQISKSPIPYLPLEIALIDLCKSES